MNPLVFALFGVMLLFSPLFFMVNARAGHSLRQLLSELQTLRPASYIRLTNPRLYCSAWRINADLIELSRYLKSGDDEDLEEIYQLKAQCRKWIYWWGVAFLGSASGGIAIQAVKLISRL